VLVRPAGSRIVSRPIICVPTDLAYLHCFYQRLDMPHLQVESTQLEATLHVFASSAWQYRQSVTDTTLTIRQLERGRQRVTGGAISHVRCWAVSGIVSKLKHYRTRHPRGTHLKWCSEISIGVVYSTPLYENLKFIASRVY